MGPPRARGTGDPGLCSPSSLQPDGCLLTFLEAQGHWGLIVQLKGGGVGSLSHQPLSCQETAQAPSALYQSFQERPVRPDKCVSGWHSAQAVCLGASLPFTKFLDPRSAQSGPREPRPRVLFCHCLSQTWQGPGHFMSL